MEIGYKICPKLLNATESNPWRFLDDNFLKEIIPEKKFTKLSALVDIGRVDPYDILPREQSVLDMIRVACYVREVYKGLELVKCSMISAMKRHLALWLYQMHLNNSL